YLSWGRYNISNHLAAAFLTTVVVPDQAGPRQWTLLVGLAAAAAGEVALGSVAFYALVYTAMGIGAFAMMLIVGRESEERQELSDYSGLAVRHPWVAAAMALFMLSLAGLPPTAGFLGKFYLLNAAVRAGMDGLAVWLVLASVVSWYYYLRVVWVMYFERPPLQPEGEPASSTPSLGAAAALAALLVFLLGVAPTMALNWAQIAASSLGRGPL
ncbi:MAG: proton-conducting transporter membrane subunit, partial [Armatimonadota bacterium]|nr:proton-conducting transporter membrane subunit [Armatimonadota bacterium]